MSLERLDAAIDEASIAPSDDPSTDHARDEVPYDAGSTLRHTLVLGTIIALGALGIDLYLPAFSAIAENLGVDEGLVQLSLVSYFVALAIGQTIYGPLSDRIGRRTPLLAGFAIFVIGSMGAALSSSIGTLVGMRFIQGLGACGGMVVPRAVVRDVRSGEEAARLFSLMLLVLGVSPILAPLLGSILLKWFPWQADFWFLTGFGLACFVMTLFLLEETHPSERRTSGGIGEAFRSYARLMRDRRFVATVLIGGFSQAVVFAYLAGSPFIYITLNHVRQEIYSLLFAVNAIGLIGSAQTNVYLIRRLGAPRLILTASTVQATSACCLLALAWFHADTVPLIAICLFFCIAAQGMLGPPTTMLSLEQHPEIAGAASALMGTLQFACGAASSALVSFFFDGTAIPLATVLAACGLAGAGLSALLASRSRRVTVA